MDPSAKRAKVSAPDADQDAAPQDASGGYLVALRGDYDTIQSL